MKDIEIKQNRKKYSFSDTHTGHAHKTNANTGNIITFFKEIFTKICVVWYKYNE